MPIATMACTTMAYRGLVAAPHPLAAQAGLAVLREGGNAIEAAVAAAAVSAVVEPHRNGLGGDAFWLIAEPGRAPLSIDACGATAQAARAERYRDWGFTAVPGAGPLAAAAVAGIVSGWQAALELSARWGGRLPLARLLEDARHHAAAGIAVTEAEHAALRRRARDLADQPGFSRHYGAEAIAGQPGLPPVGSPLRQPGLAILLERLSTAGLDDFYRGAVGHHLGAELQRLGSPLSSADLARHRSVRRRPLSVSVTGAQLFSPPPPTQGLALLMLLGLSERLAGGPGDRHGDVRLIEAARQAMAMRDTHLTDPAQMAVHPATYLSETVLDRIAAEVRAGQPGLRPAWSGGAAPDAASSWIGVLDGEGHAACCIQSLGDPFGSGVAIGEFGLLWHNHASRAGLDESDPRRLVGGRKPYHPGCPLLARLRDGRVLMIGGMGGDDQATAAASVFSRYLRAGESLHQAVTSPRWRLSPERSGQAPEVELEAGFAAEMVQALTHRLAPAGWRVEPAGETLPALGEVTALLRQPDGRLDGVADPRGGGQVAAF